MTELYSPDLVQWLTFLLRIKWQIHQQTTSVFEKKLNCLVKAKKSSLIYNYVKETFNIDS